MANGKKSFIAYSDWKDMFDELPNEDAGILIKHIFAYVNDENPTSDSILIRALFANIKTTLKRDLQKWNNQIKQRSEAGKMSAKKRLLTKTNDRLTTVEKQQRKSTDSDNVNVTDNVNMKKREEEFTRSVFLFKDKYPEEMLNKFISYWTEMNRSGTKMRFELQKTFEIPKRLVTWANNETNFNSGAKDPKMSTKYL